MYIQYSPYHSVVCNMYTLLHTLKVWQFTRFPNKISLQGFFRALTISAVGALVRVEVDEYAPLYISDAVAGGGGRQQSRHSGAAKGDWHVTGNSFVWKYCQVHLAPWVGACMGMFNVPYSIHRLVRGHISGEWHTRISVWCIDAALHCVSLLQCLSLASCSCPSWTQNRFAYVPRLHLHLQTSIAIVCHASCWCMINKAKAKLCGVI